MLLVYLRTLFQLQRLDNVELDVVGDKGKDL
jgi:hypothetical protein